MMPGPGARIERFAGAILAIAVQAGLIALLIFAHAPLAPPEKSTGELTFILPRLRPEPAPPLPMPRQSAPLLIPAPAVPLPPDENALRAAPLPQMRAMPVPPDLSAVGRALSDCRIDNYANLSPERRKHCPRPGEGMAIQDAPSLGPVRPKAKDEALWQEQWREDHFTLGLCPLGQDQLECITQQWREEGDRAKKARKALDDAKAAALKPPQPIIPSGARAR